MFFHDDGAHMEMYSAANNMNHEYGDYLNGFEKQQSTPWGSHSLHQYPTQQPDLQNAIDALMKFSISSDRMESSPRNTNNHRLGTIASRTREATTIKNGDYTLEANELWRDFPLTQHPPSTSDCTQPEQTLQDFSDKEWPASLTLSLEGTGLFQENEEQEGEHKDEKSPRLSIFERFH